MKGEPFVCSFDELPVKTFLARLHLVSGSQQDSSSFGVEGKGHTPNTIRCVESKFLHIRVARPLERIDPGPTELRSEALKEFSVSQ